MNYELAKHIWSYDPEAGILTWRFSSRGFRKGKQVGTIHKNGRTSYLSVIYRGDTYKVHRLIWLIVHGSWPVNEIDHEDGNGLNNRMSNLRDVPHVKNAQNQRKRTTNTTGTTGVYIDRRDGAWYAQIRVYYQTINLGRYATLDEATAARKAAEKQYEFHALHGTYK